MNPSVRNKASSMMNLSHSGLLSPRNQSRFDSDIYPSEQDSPLSGIPEDSTCPEHCETVGYLGSAMLSHMATGIGALQRPLAGLYFQAMLQARGNGDGSAQIPRCRLKLGSDGLCISLRDSEGNDIEQHDAGMKSDVAMEIMKKKNARSRQTGNETRPSSRQSVLSDNSSVSHSHSKSQLFTKTDESIIDGETKSTSHLGMSHPSVSSSHIRSQSRFSLCPPLPDEILHPLSNVMFWDSVLFTTVRGEDKKLRYAFTPLSKSINGVAAASTRSLFVLLDTRFHWMCKFSHCPIFACIVRCPSGVKAISMHAFLCESTEQAKRFGTILSQLQSIQSLTPEAGQSSSGVFTYQPFGKDTVRSGAGQFCRRPGVRKLSAGTNAPGISLSSRRKYGSTPALNLMFSVAAPLPSEDAMPLQYGNGAFRSSMDLTSTGSSNKSSQLSDTSVSGRSKGSSLESNIESGEYLKLGSAMSELNLSTSGQQHRERRTSRNLFSLAGRELKNSILAGLGKNTNTPATSSSNRSTYDNAEMIGDDTSITKKSNSLPNSDRMQGAGESNRVFYLVQEHFCPVKQIPEPSPEGPEAMHDKNVQHPNIPSVTINSEENVVVQSSDVVISCEPIVEPSRRPIAMVQPQQIQLDQITVEVNTSEQKRNSLTTSPLTPPPNGQSPVEHLSPKSPTQVRFIYYDDAEDSRPDPVSSVHSHETPVNDYLNRGEVRQRTEKADSGNKLHSVDNVTSNLSSKQNLAIEQSSTVPSSATTENRNTENKSYGFSYVINDVVTHKQCTPLVDKNTNSGRPMHISILTIVDDELPKQTTPDSHKSGQSNRELNNLDKSNISIASGKDQLSNLAGVEVSNKLNIQDCNKLRSVQGFVDSSKNRNVHIRSKSSIVDRREMQLAANRTTAQSQRLTSPSGVHKPGNEKHPQKVMNWQFRCPPPTVTSDYRTLRPDEIAVESDTVRKENQNKAEKKEAEIATELENLAFATDSVLRRAVSHYDLNFEKSLGYFP